MSAQNLNARIPKENPLKLGGSYDRSYKNIDCEWIWIQGGCGGSIYISLLIYNNRQINCKYSYTYTYILCIKEREREHIHTTLTPTLHGRKMITKNYSHTHSTRLNGYIHTRKIIYVYDCSSVHFMSLGALSGPERWALGKGWVSKFTKKGVSSDTVATQRNVIPHRTIQCGRAEHKTRPPPLTKERKSIKSRADNVQN